jgi:hypothetical protein
MIGYIWLAVFLSSGSLGGTLHKDSLGGAVVGELRKINCKGVKF